MSLKNILKKNKLLAIIVSILASLIGVSFFINIITVQSYPIVGDYWNGTCKISFTPAGEFKHGVGC